jgi:UDP-3-O-[3-hydroxymyristoyl] glucosamine N-acyltransferase
MLKSPWLPRREPDILAETSKSIVSVGAYGCLLHTEPDIARQLSIIPAFAPDLDTASLAGARAGGVGREIEVSSSLGRPVRIGRNVWIGAGAIILPGVSIADDAQIGAGSAVIRCVPAGVTAFGNPARVQAATSC